ncbi:MAG: hypothetical protein RJA49_1331, partial [Actinomycetota bacterium]
MTDEPTPTTFDDDLVAISQWVGDVTPPDPWLLSSSSTPTEPESTERPAWQRALAVVASIALVLVGVFALTRGQGTKHASRPSATTELPPTSTAESTPPSTVAGSPAGWTPAAQSPLSPRNEAQGVWTGREVLVFGGTTQPQCPVCDYASSGDTLHDGAAYDPSTDSWRIISSLPPDASYIGQSVLVGGDVFFYSLFQGTAVATPATYRLWRYSVAKDAWTEMRLPPTLPLGAVLTARQNALVLASSSDDQGSTPDWTYSLQDSKWTQLPDDPFDPSFDRHMLEVDGALMLFNHSMSVITDSSKPGLVRAARFDEGTQKWTVLPESDQLDVPWFADGPLAIAPTGGSADGGQVNNWGRDIPFGGWLDTTDDSWHPLPPPVPEGTIGVIG